VIPTHVSHVVVADGFRCSDLRRGHVQLPLRAHQMRRSCSGVLTIGPAVHPTSTNEGVKHHRVSFIPCVSIRINIARGEAHVFCSVAAQSSFRWPQVPLKARFETGSSLSEESSLCHLAQIAFQLRRMYLVASWRLLSKIDMINRHNTVPGMFSLVSERDERLVTVVRENPASFRSSHTSPS
jgi:hypothetical protein